ncbi:MAG: DNA polymerase IV [Lachnospiraceae bacterium]|nr:DNA polymerase IV [Lachnospiraceae bacterium]
MDRIIFHIDVNSAYLSWSALEKLQNGSDLDLRTIPAIIGGDIARRHGVVLAKSIPAKAYGIVTGEPIVNAMRKCPGLTLEPPNHSLYSRRSQELMTLLSDFCPDIEQVSVDECYMDYTPIHRRYASPEEAAHLIRNRVYEELGFTVNVGISNRKVLAKMASDFRKPNLVHTLYVHEIPDKLWPLPVSSLYMCGHSSAETLRKLEILTIGDLARANRDVLMAHLKNHGVLLWEYANGIDASTVTIEQTEAKGIGNSTTLSQDAADKETAHRVLLSLAESVAGRLRKSGQAASMISTEIKYNTFKKVSHQTTLLTPTSQTDVIYQTACTLFDEIWDGTPARLLGIRSSKLVSEGEPVQLSLFDLPSPASSGAAAGLQAGPSSPRKREQLDQALDAIRRRYGAGAVVRGSLLASHPQQKSKHKKQPEDNS